MGIYDREYYRGDTEGGFSLGGSRSMVTNLIIANVAVFVLDAIFQGPQGVGPASQFLALQAENLRQPWMWWRFLSYGFAHADPAHIIGNMLGLFFFGRSIEATYGPTRFLGMYLTAVLLGGIGWALPASMMQGVVPILLGASCAITAIIILFCFHFPKQTVLFMLVIPMPAWVLGVLFVLADVTGQLGGNRDNVAHGVHLIGAAYGYLFFRTRFELLQFLAPNWLGKLKRNFKPRPKLKLHDPGSERPDDLDRKADAVLAKLHRQGESSLSQAERKVLEDYSRRMKQKHQ